MRTKAFLGLALCLSLLLALLPPVAGDEDHQHGAPTADPLRFDMTKYLTADGGMSLATPSASVEATAIPAPESSPVQSEAVKFVATAESNYSKRFLGKLTLFVQFDAPPVGVNGTGTPGFGVALAKNGQELTFSQFAPAESPAKNTTDPSRYDISVLGFDLPWKKGDTMEVWVYYYGVNKADNPTVHYLVGNSSYNSSLWMPMRYESIEELGHKHVNPDAKHFLLSEFDLFDTKRPYPGAEPVDNKTAIINVRFFHYGFAPDPIVVKNGTHVFLRFYYDPALDDFASDNDPGLPPAPPPNPDDSGSLHGWSTNYDPSLTTRFYGGEVVIVEFDATRPGEYFAACTVYCGKSHYNMGGKFVILGGNGTTDGGPGGDDVEDGGGGDGVDEPPNPTPGFEALSVLFAMGVIVYARRRKAM